MFSPTPSQGRQHTLRQQIR